MSIIAGLTWVLLLGLLYVALKQTREQARLLDKLDKQLGALTHSCMAMGAQLRGLQNYATSHTTESMSLDDQYQKVKQLLDRGLSVNQIAVLVPMEISEIAFIAKTHQFLHSPVTPVSAAVNTTKAGTSST